MDLKLRARLSAYSRLDNSCVSEDIPAPDKVLSGSVLGVDTNGCYTLFSKTDVSKIDELFMSDTTKTVTKEDIDSLFNSKIDVSDAQNSSVVTYAEIDSMFD